ncbi:MAG: hypothetical protein Q8Q83_01215 [Pseudomonas sp.]|nr:hypothetical protein [Pseudomonas sp.]MDP3813681.1 hypothetical protein [Pseudomonas sp.]
MVAASLAQQSALDGVAGSTARVTGAVREANANWRESAAAQNAAINTYHNAERAQRERALAEQKAAEQAAKATAEAGKQETALRRLLGSIDSTERGHVTGNRTISINKANLFGGEKKEGGIKGPLDVMMGGPAQPVNASLASMLGGIVPAFRGVATLFFDGMIGAMNPYPKPWAMRMRRILKGWDNDEVWYPEKAQIIMVPVKPLALYLALDLSSSMNTETANGQTRLENMKAAVIAALQLIAEMVLPMVAVDIMIVGWGGNTGDFMARSSITRRAVSAASIDELIAWVEERTAPNSTYFPSAVADAPGFFAASPAGYVRISLFITDGGPTIPGVGPGDEANDAATEAGQTLLGISSIRAYGINIDLDDTSQTDKLDNTGDDGVPVVSGGDPTALVDAIMNALGSVYAMNPAHIIYQAYTDRSWGRGLDPAIRLDLDSFAAVADKLYAERFGLCIKWTRQDKLAVFVGSIINHIGGSIYVSRRSGKLVLNLIRDDYDVEDLPLFTPDTGLLGIDDDDATADDKSVNCVVVKYRDPLSNEIMQVRARNLAAITAHGLNQQTTEYIGIPSGTLAARVAQRDLTAYSSGVKRLKVRLDRRARDSVFPGSVFRVSDPRRGIENLVLRAGRVEDGILTSGQITVAAIKDVFGLPETSYAEPVLPGWTAPDSTALPIQYQRLIELPYRDLVRITAPADMALIDDTAAFLMPLASKPSPLSMGYEITSRVGTSGNFEERGGGDFISSAILVAGIGYLDTNVTITDGVDLYEITAGTAALIDDEIVRIDSIDITSGELVLGRGCGDTVPAKHEAGARIWFLEGAAGSDPTEYVSGATVHAKLLTRTSSDLLALGSAPEVSVEMMQRQVRPYPPGRFLINGLSYPDVIVNSPEINLSWSHRDRLLEDDNLIDTTMGDIGPELGTTYTARALRFDTLEVLTEITAVAGTSADLSPEYEGAIIVELFSVRGGLASWQTHQHPFDYITNEERLTEDGEGRITESDEIRILEA